MDKAIVSVLAIDDDRAILRNYVSYLEDCGFEVRTADNGREGLEQFDREPADVVLVDLRMPEVDGLEVLGSITDKSPDTPVVVISGTGEIADVVEALHRGAWDFLQKPIEDLSVLHHIIDKVLERAWLIRENRVYQQQLEQLVEERTEALRAANQELHASREELRSVADRYRLLTENQRDVVFAISPAGEVTYCSPAIVDLGGYQPGDLSDRRFEDFFVSADDVSRLFERLRSARSSPGSEAMDLLFKPKQGEPFRVEISGKPVLDGEQVVAIQCVMRDITDRVRVEAERQRLAIAVEHAAEEIIVTDTQGVIQYVNPSFESVTGYTRDEVIGKNQSILSGEHDQAFFEQLWHGKVWTGRFVHRKKDGGLLQEEATISPIRDETGQLVGFVSVLRDITDQINLRAQLRRAQKMEAIGTLAGGIAHDFNNILSAILGYTELAAHSVEEDSPLRKDLNQVLIAAERARQLVAQILAFSRQAEQEHSPFQVSRVVKEVMQLLRASLPSTLTIRLRLEAETETVLGDPTQIHQVLLNLCTNAAQAMGNGEGLLEVTLVAEPAGTARGRHLRLTVRDTGPGMAPEMIERIFEPYFTTKPKGEGTGLGLAVVHGIVKNHGGEIMVESTVGEGSAFHVLLPVVASKPESYVQAERSPEPGSEHVLLVDDEEMLVEMMRRWLESLGYQVSAKTSSREALQLFRVDPQHFDLVVSDQTMPGMTGAELAQELYQIRPELPIILCTGYIRAISPDSIQGLGNVRCLGKPVSLTDLAREVRRALDGQEENG
jgi:PAS domain S-box-containing protein